MRIMGRRRALGAVLAGAFLLAGCSAGPGQVGAAAIIDGQVTSLDQVQTLLDRAVQEHPYARQLASRQQLDLVGREIVRQELLHEVVTKAARKENIAVDETVIGGLLQQDPLSKPIPEALKQNQPMAVTQLVWRLRDHREALVDQYLEQQLVAKYLPTLTVDVDLASTGSPNAESRAPAIDPKVARGQAIAKAEEYAKNPSLVRSAQEGDPSNRLDLRVPAQAVPQDASTVLFGVSAGNVVAYQPTPATAPTYWLIAVVKQRSTGTPVATDQVPPPTAAQLTAIGVRMLQPYLGDVSFKINPRYGVWDVVGMDLAPTANDLKGIVVPVHGGAPAKQ